MAKCATCRMEIPPWQKGEPCSNYGRDRSCHKHCIPCCGERDRRSMVKHGRATLYLTYDRSKGVGGEITNWPGNLRFACRVRIGRHNIAGRRYDAWFTGPDGREWHGVQYGDWTQIIHCKRIGGVA